MLKIKELSHNILDNFRISVFFTPKSEAFWCESICILLFFPAINFFLNQILQTYFSFSSISYIFYLIMAAIGATSYFVCYPKASKGVVGISLWMLVFTLFAFIIYPQIRNVLINNDLNPLSSAILGLFFYQIPIMVYTSSINDWHSLVRKCTFYSTITVLLGIVSFYYFTIQAGSEDIPNYMVYSYNLLAGLGPFVVISFISKNIFANSILLVGLICLIVVGARGAQISFLLIVITCIIEFSNKKEKTISLLVLFGILLLLALDNLDYMSSCMDSLLGEYGAHSRTLTKLMEGDFFSQSGRDVLRNIIYEGISNNPFGYGIFGDRYLTAVGGWGEPAYCHNILLEMCCDFGILFGPILFLWVCHSILKLIKVKVNLYKKYFLLFLLPCGFFELLFSGSYLVSITFFAILGLILNKKKYEDLSHI